ncbi:MAG TPA: hypothetical protein VFZ66_27485 [Herpetosiphonaceae bacterium]
MSQPTSQRLLLIACSKSKRTDPGLLPARERYTGGAYHTLNKAEREGVTLPQVLILSAEFGFLRPTDPIPAYDRTMTAQQVLELEPVLRAQWAHIVVPLLPGVTSTLVVMGYTYRSALIRADALLDLPGLVIALGGLGRQRQQLKDWLRATPGG